MPNTFTPAVKIKQHTYTHLPTNGKTLSISTVRSFQRYAYKKKVVYLKCASKSRYFSHKLFDKNLIGILKANLH